MFERHSVSREGVTAGLIGASAVALWFLIIDTMAGRAFHTPDMLGGSLMSVLGPRGSEGLVTHVLFYTIFHYAVFIGVGVVLAWLVARAREEPTLLAGLLIVFVAFEVGWYGWTGVLADSQNFGAFAWWQVGVANLIAAGLMGGYLWRQHPELVDSLEAGLGGHDYTPNASAPDGPAAQP